MIKPSVIIQRGFQDEFGVNCDAVVFLADDNRVRIRPLGDNLQGFTVDIGDFLQIAESLKTLAKTGARLT
jgi:hypothetical protein